ncbi:hypothetical protein [Ensifer adhaerens]
MRCASTRSIVAAISSFLAEDECKHPTAHSSMTLIPVTSCVSVSAPKGGRALEMLKDEFKPIADRFGMEFEFFDSRSMTRLTAALARVRLISPEAVRTMWFKAAFEAW